jgi:hypothetical protein
MREGFVLRSSSKAGPHEAHSTNVELVFEGFVEELLDFETSSVVLLSRDEFDAMVSVVDSAKAAVAALANERQWLVKQMNAVQRLQKRLLERSHG